MSDANGSPPPRDEGTRSGPGSPVSGQLQTTLQQRTRRLREEETRNSELEGELIRATREKEAAIEQTKEINATKPTMTAREREQVEHLRRTVSLLESQAAEHEATLAHSIKLEGRVLHLETQLDRAKAEIENEKMKVQHEEKTSSDYKNMLAVENRKTPELEKKYASLSDLYERREEEFNNKEKEFKKMITALETKYDAQARQHKTLDAEKKQAEILNAKLEMQVQTLAVHLEEAEAKIEQSQKDAFDIIREQKAQLKRESSPSCFGREGGEGPVRNLADELSDAASSQGSASSNETQVQDLAYEALEELQQKAASLETDSTKLRGEVADLRKEIAALTEERDVLQKKVSELEEENHGLRKQNEDLSDERYGLQKMTASLEQSNNKLQDEVAGLKKEAVDRNAEKDTLQKEASERTHDAGKLGPELHEEMERLQKQISQLQEENAGLQKRASDLSGEAGKLESELEAENDRLRNQVTDLQAENEGFRKSATELTDDTGELHAESKAEKEKLREELSALQKQNEELQEQASALASGAKKLQDELAETVKALQTATEDQHSFQQLQDQRNEASEELAAANDQLKTELELAREDTKRHQAAIAQLEAEKRNVQAELPNSQEIENRIGALPEEHDNLQRELQKELDAEEKALDQVAKAQDPGASEAVGDSYEQVVSDLLQSKADLAGQLEGMEENQQNILEELEGQTRQNRDLRAQVEALKAQIDEFRAQLDESKARQDEHQKRHQELMDDESASELDLTKIRDAATSARTKGQATELDPADALRERIAVLNVRLDEAQQEREDARREAPAEEPAEEGGEELNSILAQLQRGDAEGERTQARREAELAQRREQKRQEKCKDRAHKKLPPIPEAAKPGEDDGASGPGQQQALGLENQALGERVRQLEREYEAVVTAVNTQNSAINVRDQRIEQLQTLVTAQAMPAGPPPPPTPSADVLVLPRADLPGRVRARNRSLRGTFAATLRDLRSLLTLGGILQVRSVFSQPKVVLFILYAAIFALLGMIMAEGRRCHHWAVANDVSRAMYVNRNWYVAFVLPDLHPWEQWVDLAKEFK